MGKIKYCELNNRKLLKVGGDEAEAFLQGILTCNLESILPNEAGFGGLLTPQGKILFDFFVIRDHESFILDVDTQQIDELVRRLTFYRLRANVSFEVYEDGTKVFACWDGDIQLRNAQENCLMISIADPRLVEMGYRIYSRSAPDDMEKADMEMYEAHRIGLGIPEGGVDYQYGSAFPHEALYDQIGGVDFSKGCYVGQEVVSRMHHRGTARKRFIQITSENNIPSPGSKVTVLEKNIGEVSSVAGHNGLAILRLDHVSKALLDEQEIQIEDVVVTPYIQSWANFNWPSEKQAK